MGQEGWTFEQVPLLTSHMVSRRFGERIWSGICYSGLSMMIELATPAKVVLIIEVHLSHRSHLVSMEGKKLSQRHITE